MGVQNLQNIKDAIYSAIKASVGTAMGNRIYEIESPQDTQLPNCTFQIVANVVTPGLSKSISSDITLQVDFWGDKGAGTKSLTTISDTLFNDFDRSVLALAISGAVVQGTVQGLPTIEDNITRVRQEYDILAV